MQTCALPILEQVRPSLLQFHGDEDDAFCRGIGVPYVKAIGMGNALVEDAVALPVGYPGAAADRNSVVAGKSVSVRVDLGGRRVIQKNNRPTEDTLTFTHHTEHDKTYE